MKLTIIPSDGTVQKDGESYKELNLTACNIPSDVHALQWYGDSGEIEYIDHTLPNETINVLPQWATDCVAVWDNKDYEEKNPPPPTEAEIKVARIDELKALLAETDYVALNDYDKEKLDAKADRQAWRDEIRTLQAQINL